jgi:zinc transport system ATP-binding protein
VVEIENLDFSYSGVAVLKDVNLSIQPRDSTCVVGPNGGGKSTLIRIMLGLLTPTRGRVRLLGGSPEEKRNRVGYVPQHSNFDPLFPVTVMDVTLMGRLAAQGVFGFGFSYSKKDREDALQALEEMELGSLAGRKFAELSGGQRQRVLIARALVSAVDLVILDEPTSHIDAHVEGNLFEIMLELNKRMAIILVTHDLGFTSQFFKSVICVNRKVHVHPTSEISGEIIQHLYGGDIKMIRHDHRCAAGGHVCD